MYVEYWVQVTPFRICKVTGRLVPCPNFKPRQQSSHLRQPPYPRDRKLTSEESSTRLRLFYALILSIFFFMLLYFSSSVHQFSIFFVRWFRKQNIWQQLFTSNKMTLMRKNTYQLKLASSRIVYKIQIFRKTILFHDDQFTYHI